MNELVVLGAQESGVGAALLAKKLGIPVFVSDAGLIPGSFSDRLDEAGIPWEMGFEGENEQVIEATVAADLAVSARMRGALPAEMEPIESPNALPPLGQLHICLYDAGTRKDPVGEAIRAQIRCAYCC